MLRKRRKRHKVNLKRLFQAKKTVEWYLKGESIVKISDAINYLKNIGLTISEINYALKRLEVERKIEIDRKRKEIVVLMEREGKVIGERSL